MMLRTRERKTILDTEVCATTVGGLGGLSAFNVRDYLNLSAN